MSHIQTKTSCRESGFTFVELCIVVMVMGLMIAGFLAGYMVYAQKQRYEITRERTAALQYALESYAMANNRLPCPADPTIPVMAAGVGKEVGCAAGATAPAGIQTSGTGDTEIWRGSVPTNVLRIGGDGGVDGWGNRLTYVVSRKLTLPNGQKADAVTGERPFGVIKIVDISGTEILDAGKLARFVLLSSGPTGKGAFTQQGVQRSVPTGSKEAPNYNNGDTFVMAALSRKDGAGFYDDVLIHDESIKTNPDLADRVLYCNGKQLFFAPDKPGADADGCLGNSITIPNCAEGEILTAKNGAFQCMTNLATPGNVAGHCAGEGSFLVFRGVFYVGSTPFSSPSAYISALRIIPPAVMSVSSGQITTAMGQFSAVGHGHSFSCGCAAGWRKMSMISSISQTYTPVTDGGGVHGAVSAGGSTYTCVKENG